MAYIRIEHDRDDTPEQIAKQLFDLAKRCEITTKCLFKSHEMAAYPIDVNADGPLERWKARYADLHSSGGGGSLTRNLPAGNPRIYL